MLYKWDDAGAPVLEYGVAGSYINMLEKCLVTGYGSKTALGWTQPFGTSSHVTAFRPPSGNRFYLKIDDNLNFVDTTYDKDYYYVKAEGFEGMTSLLGTSGPFTNAASTGKNDYLSWTYARSDFQPSDIKWILVGSDTFFCVIVNICSKDSETEFSPNYTNLLHFFGDIDNADPSDGFASVISGSNNYPQLSLTSDHYPINSMVRRQSPKNLDTWAGTPRVYDQVSGPGRCLHPSYTYLSYPNTRPPMSGKLVYFPIPIVDNTANGTSVTKNYRGTLPKIYRCYSYIADLEYLGLFQGCLLDAGDKEFTVVCLPNYIDEQDTNVTEPTAFLIEV